jgi:hypothetical protein
MVAPPLSLQTAPPPSATSIPVTTGATTAKTQTDC